MRKRERWGLLVLASLAIAACGRGDPYQQAIGDYVCLVDDSGRSEVAALRIEDGRIDALMEIPTEQGAPDPILGRFDMRIERDGEYYLASGRLPDTTSPAYHGPEWNQEFKWRFTLAPAAGRTSDIANASLDFTLSPRGEHPQVRYSCVRAEVSKLFDEVNAATREAGVRHRKLAALGAERWFRVAAQTRSDEPSCRIRRDMIVQTAMTDGNTHANMRAAVLLDFLKFQGCISETRFEPPGGLGLETTTPADWRQRLTRMATGAEGKPEIVQAPLEDPAGKDAAPAAAIRVPEEAAASQLLPPMPARPEPQTGQSGASASAPMRTASSTNEAAQAPAGPATDSRDRPISSVAANCKADAPAPQMPEEKDLVANGRRFLTGRSSRGRGAGGEFLLVEAALGYDGQCRPDPYQIYVFKGGELVGTLSPQAMRARSDGAIVEFAMHDDHTVQIEVAHYQDNDPACCPSSIETRLIDLREFNRP